MICLCGPEWRNPECDEHGNAIMECVQADDGTVVFGGVPAPEMHPTSRKPAREQVDELIALRVIERFAGGTIAAVIADNRIVGAETGRTALLAIRSHLDAVCSEADRSIDIDHLRDLVAEGLGEGR